LFLRRQDDIEHSMVAWYEKSNQKIKRVNFSDFSISQ